MTRKERKRHAKALKLSVQRMIQHIENGGQ
jgi:hypothetical protein